MNNPKKHEIEKTKDNNLIKLYPFNGRSPYLIDKFYIIGYNYLTLHKLLIENFPKSIGEENEKETKDFHKFTIDEEPDILNEITSDYNKVGLPNEAIINMIYPKKLDFYYTSEDNTYNSKKSYNRITISSNTRDFSKIDFNEDIFIQNIAKSINVVFSSNPQSENNSKKSINGFAYIFYRKFVERKNYNKKKYTYYIPYTFCITSEYPYFNSFYKLCKCIRNFFNQNIIHIPIEFLIYNIVSLSPSPLNSDVLLDLKNSFDNFNQAISNFSNSRSTFKDSNNDIMPMNIFNTDSDIKNMNDIKKLQKIGFVFVEEEDNYNTKKRNSVRRIFTQRNNSGNTINNNKTSEIENQIIKFNCLSGYPLIQYNLPKVLLNNLSPEKVITIFLYTFLEKDVIFFSKDIEYLTLTLNAYLNLNFPLNDEKYYFIGAAISFKDFSCGNSEFGLKNYTSIIGINDIYRSDYKNKNLKIQDHLVIDLDKGEIYPADDENNNNVNERNKKIIKLIKRICDGNEEEKAKKITLYHAIKNLSERLKKIYELMFDSYGKKIYCGEFLDYDCPDEVQKNLNKNNNIMNNNLNSLDINLKNIEIQEAFYEFVHNVCLYFYENLSIKAKEDEQNKEKNNIKVDKDSHMNVIFNKNYAVDNSYTEEEIIFLDELTDTMKFQSFVFGFLQSYNPIDLYKIPLTFTEEFLSIISRKKAQIINNNTKITFFKLIDSLYNTGKNKDPITINFDVINFNYFKKYKNIFDREIYDKFKKKYFDDNRQLIKFISGKTSKIINEGNLNQRFLIYQTYELDDNLLLKYLHFTKNLNQREYTGGFYGSFYIEENQIKSININEIETRIENYCITNKILSNSDICCANIILLFTLSLKSLRETIDCQTFLGILFQEFTVFRKYYSILLRAIYKLYQEPHNIKNYTSTLCYYPCINSIRNKKLVPNEDLMNQINQFNKINIDDLNFQDEEKKQKEENKKDESNKSVKLYGEQLEEQPISNKNLYVWNNFTHDRFINEGRIVKYINKSIQSDLFEVYLKNGKKITPQIRFNNGLHKNESFFVSQKLLLEKLYYEYNKYIEDLDENNLGAKIILDACLNIFIFMRNTEDFEDKDDLFEVLQCIFYIFMNQLIILKSIKEKSINSNYK